MMPVWVIRPQPGNAATEAKARAIGVETRSQPLFIVRPCSWAAPDPASIDGLLIGSANAVRHAGAALAKYRGMPVHAVGENTMAAAISAGLAEGKIGEGGLQDVLDALPPTPQRLLRLAGAVRVALDSPAHITLETRVVYAATPVPMPPEMAAQLREGAVVLLHSAAAARHFAAECDRLNVPRAAIAIAALGPRIAAAAGEGWAACTAAQMPHDSALLALASKMCQ